MNSAFNYPHGIITQGSGGSNLILRIEETIEGPVYKGVDICGPETHSWLSRGGVEHEDVHVGLAQGNPCWLTILQRDSPTFFFMNLELSWASVWKTLSQSTSKGWCLFFPGKKKGGEKGTALVMALLTRSFRHRGDDFAVKMVIYGHWCFRGFFSYNNSFFACLMFLQRFPKREDLVVVVGCCDGWMIKVWPPRFQKSPTDHHWFLCRHEVHIKWTQRVGPKKHKTTTRIQEKWSCDILSTISK